MIFYLFTCFSDKIKHKASCSRRKSVEHEVISSDEKSLTLKHFEFKQ